MTVPFNFATQSGNIPLSELDANFANVSAHTLTATYVTGNNQSNITNVGTLNSLAVYGNVTAGNVSTTGIVRANLVIGVNYTGTNVSVTGNVNAGTNINAVGTVVGNNISANNTVSAAVVSATGNAIGGNLVTAGYVTAVGNIIGGNVQTPNLVVNYIYSDDSTYVIVDDGLEIHGGLISEAVDVTGNVTATGTLTIGGDSTIDGNLTVNGNITYINSNVITINDKSITLANNQSTAANVDGAGIDIGNPTVVYWQFNNATTSWQSNVGITPAANGVLNLGGASNYWANAYLTTASVTGNVTSNFFIGNVSGATIAATGNVQAGNLLTTGGISATGNIYSAAALRTGGLFSSTGNITGGNVNTGGLISATGDITGGNVNTGGELSVVGNVQAGNLRSTGGISVTGNIYSNTALRTGGTVSATGNITGNYFIGNGSQLTDVIAVGVGTLSSLSVTGNGTFGNINTGGAVSATGNVDINGTLSVVGGIRSSGNIYSVQTLRTGGAISSLGNVTGGNLITNTSGAVITAPTALANLTAVAGARAFVNNGNLVAVSNFGAQIGSGGANVVPVWSDGTNWYIG